MTSNRLFVAGLAASLALVGCSKQPATQEKAGAGAPAAAPVDAGQARAQAAAPAGSAQQQAQAGLAAEPKKIAVKVWFLDDERMKTGEEPMFVPVERQVPEEGAPRAAVEAVFAGPTEEEKARGLRHVASQATGFSELRVEDGIAHVRLAGGCHTNGSTASIANELMPTLKQFPGVQAVKIYDPEGKTGEPTGRVDSIPFCLEP